MSTLERRLARLENVLLPKPQLSVCMLSEPASDASAEHWAEYRRQVDEAKARGDFLILLVQAKPTESPRTETGVTYCSTELDALALKASMLPSSLGNKSGLDDVMKSLPGNVFGPVRAARFRQPRPLNGRSRPLWKAFHKGRLPPANYEDSAAGNDLQQPVGRIAAGAEGERSDPKQIMAAEEAAAADEAKAAREKKAVEEAVLVTAQRRRW